MHELTALVDAADIRKAYNRLKGKLAEDAIRSTSVLGWQGQDKADNSQVVYYHPEQCFWSLLKPLDNRYWCCYGTRNPDEWTSLEITCEINPPLEGENRRAAGLFAVDNAGALYLTHSGKVGGGRPNIGKSTFLSFYRGRSLTDIQWPSGKVTQAILVGCLEDDEFLGQLGHFIYEVERFKQQAAEGSLPVAPATEDTDDETFSAEFFGKRSKYALSAQIRAQCNHGFVVNALASEIEKLGLVPLNDIRRDLYVRGGNGHVSHLFEVKTDIDTTNVYCSVGQLLINAKLDRGVPLKVLIIPEPLSPKIQEAVTSLGIVVLIYDLKRSTTIFSDRLGQLVRAT